MKFLHLHPAAVIIVPIICAFVVFSCIAYWILA